MKNFAILAQRLACIAFVSALLPLAGWAAPGENRVKAKDFIVEPTTLISAGFEWYVDGDDNTNASVSVTYRKQGTADWKEALPLFRLHAEQGNIGSFHFVAPNMFGGSILDLSPDTEYECRFMLSDPDGVKGHKEKRVVVRTRAEPMPSLGGHVYHVYPTDWKGPKEEPNFYSLYDAYFLDGGRVIVGDWYDVFPPRVQPGDTILMHGGLYKDDRYHYAHEERTPRDYGVPGFTGAAAPGANNKCCGTTWDGTYYLTASGTPDKPIVIKAAGDGEVIFDGDGNHMLFNLLAANYTYIEGITFRNTDVAIEAGLKNIVGATGLTVKHCRFEQVGAGVHSDWSGSQNFYIVDNVFIGRNDPDKVLPWFIKPPFMNMGLTAPPGLSRLAVRVYGSGHVIAFNEVRNFHDGIDLSTYGLPDGYPNAPRDRMPVSNDVYNNDISNVHDDCFEVDGMAFNVRVMRNRCINLTGSGFRFNAAWGGPAYLIRNVVYHAPANFQAILMVADTSGVLVYNNTLIAAVRSIAGSNYHFRNNLILAEDPADPAFEVDTSTSNTDSDYNGFMPGPMAKTAFAWRGPAAGISADYKGKRENHQFTTLSAFSQATGQDRHSVMLDFAAFANLQPVDVSNPLKVYDPNQDFSLRSNSPAVDAGIVLPNVTDGFTGKAPDLGAWEVGQPVPHYGPRQ